MREEQEFQEQEERQEEQEKPAGFIDKDKWVEMGRDPDEWRDPDEFEERGEKITSVLKKQRDELKAEIDAFKQDFTSYRTQQQDITIRKEREAYERAKAEHAAEIAAIRAEKKRAVEEMDGDALIRAEERQENLVAPSPPREMHAPEPNPEFVSWVQKNEWYGKDEDLREYADLLSHKFLPDVQSGRMTVTQALEKTAERVKKQFGHKFGNERRNQAAPVAEGGPGRTSGKTYRDLPADAKAACERFAKRGIMTKEQYIKDYFGE